MKTSHAIIIVGLVLCLMLVSPFILIWAVNGLFGTSVEYTFLNWVYVMILLVFLKSSIQRK
jgi:hypothetical protein